jgi:DNA modification methylase
MAPKKKAAKKTAKATSLPNKGKVLTAKARKTKPAPKAAQVIPQATTPPKPQEEITITAAKGRPMLTWVGKRPLRAVTPFPAQQVESLTAPDVEKVLIQTSETWKDWPPRYLQGGLLFHGDNKEVLAHLLANGFRGKVQLIYIDPPFDSGADYIRKVSIRGTRGTAKLAGESYSLGEQIQYTDIWAKDNYLQFLYERLLLLKELLSEEGAIVVHCDWHQGHRIRLVLDEVFAEENFRNEIVWHYGQRTAIRDRQFDMKHDNLFFYAKSKSMVLAESTVPWSYEEFIQHRHDVLKDEDEREFIWTDGGPGNERYKRYVDEVIAAGKPLDSVWDLPLLNSSDQQRQGFPTQKPDYLLERLIRTLSKPGGIILDCFIGSGTTAAVAQKLGRRWIGCDINKGAVQTTAKRLQTIIQEQIEEEKHACPRTAPLPGMEADSKDEVPKPAQLGFTTWRVNDYDLAVQHNEAVNLACEHIGVTRTLSDSFFDGTLGQKLVKIIPFGHPLSLTDLEDVRAKIESRPNDSRDVVVVCLGKELGVESWLANWNRMRKQGNTPNKIEVIELRTDPKYGKFFAHKPAQARVKVCRADGKLTIEVQDFISPTILERLQEQAGPLLAPKVTDWRTMVDSVMIDPAYDGKVFNIILADVPECKQDLVQGRYELPAPKSKIVVAVKVTDMLGEEVLVQQEV